MKAFFLNIRAFVARSAFTRIFLEANELWLAVLLILCWPLHQIGLRILDDTAAPLDAGVLSTLYAAALYYAFLRGFVWFGQRINIPFLWLFTEKMLAEQFKELTPAEQCAYAQRQQLWELSLAVACLIAAALTAG